MPENRDVERVTEALIKAGLDEHGFLSDERILETIKAIGKSEIPHKIGMLEAYRRAAQRLRLRQQAVVTSASALTSGEHEEIEQSIRHRHPEVKKVIWQIDEALVGGITVLIADQWYDFSIRQQLATIKERLSV